jgi:hypothetical protein
MCNECTESSIPYRHAPSCECRVMLCTVQSAAATSQYLQHVATFHNLCCLLSGRAHQTSKTMMDGSRASPRPFLARGTTEWSRLPKAQSLAWTDELSRARFDRFRFDGFGVSWQSRFALTVPTQALPFCRCPEKELSERTKCGNAAAYVILFGIFAVDSR